MGSTRGIRASREVLFDKESAMPVISPAVNPISARSVKDIHQTLLKDKLQRSRLTIEMTWGETATKPAKV